MDLELAGELNSGNTRLIGQNNFDLEIPGKLLPFFGHWTSPPLEMSTLVLKNSVSRKG
jgi:hypothetical protein